MLLKVKYCIMQDNIDKISFIFQKTALENIFKQKQIEITIPQTKTIILCQP